MKQAVLIVPSVNTKFDIKGAIKKIISYVGTRMVSNDVDDCPGVLLKETLPKEDKKNLQKIVFPDNGAGTLVFIAVREEAGSDCDYVNTEYVDEED